MKEPSTFRETPGNTRLLEIGNMETNNQTLNFVNTKLFWFSALEMKNQQVVISGMFVEPYHAFVGAQKLTLSSSCLFQLGSLAPFLVRFSVESNRIFFRSIMHFHLGFSNFGLLFASVMVIEPFFKGIQLFSANLWSFGGFYFLQHFYSIHFLIPLLRVYLWAPDSFHFILLNATSLVKSILKRIEIIDLSFLFLRMKVVPAFCMLPHYRVVVDLQVDVYVMTSFFKV